MLLRGTWRAGTFVRGEPRHVEVYVEGSLFVRKFHSFLEAARCASSPRAFTTTIHDTAQEFYFNTPALLRKM